MPLLKAADKAVKAKDMVDEVLEECGAAFKDDDSPKGVSTKPSLLCSNH